MAGRFNEFCICDTISVRFIHNIFHILGSFQSQMIRNFIWITQLQFGAFMKTKDSVMKRQKKICYFLYPKHLLEFNLRETVTPIFWYAIHIVFCDYPQIDRTQIPENKLYIECDLRKTVLSETRFLFSVFCCCCWYFFCILLADTNILYNWIELKKFHAQQNENGNFVRENIHYVWIKFFCC